MGEPWTVRFPAQTLESRLRSGQILCGQTAHLGSTLSEF